MFFLILDITIVFVPFLFLLKIGLFYDPQMEYSFSLPVRSRYVLIEGKAEPDFRGLYHMYKKDT